MLNLSRSQLIIISLSAFIILIAILLFFGFIPGFKKNLGPVTPLTIWGVYDDQSSFAAGLSRFRSAYPNITVKYVKKEPATYKSDLLNALATGQSPDIIMINNSAVSDYADKIYPIPSSFLSLSDLRSLFPYVIEQDLVMNDRLYALPLYIDTLALYYNQDYFDAAGLIYPPITWQNFVDVVYDIKLLEDNNRIERAGAAFGGSHTNIPRATDIISVLMMQLDVPMVKESSRAADFSSSAAGFEAVKFYTDFANPSAAVYTWNESMNNAVDVFAAGDAVMMIDYSFVRQELNAKNPFLRFSIARLPQLNPKNPINYADYYNLAVLNRSPYKSEALTLISYLTTNKTAALSYYRASGKSPALKSLIPVCRENTDLAPFCDQTLTARSWFNGHEPQIKNTFSEMIRSVILGQSSIRDAIKKAETSVTSALRDLD